MNTYFKKSIVALAIAGASMGAQAVTFSGTEIELGKEGLTTATGTGTNISVSAAVVANSVDVDNGGAFVITLGENVPVGGLVRVKFNTKLAKGGTSNFAYTATAPATSDTDAVLTVANTGDDFVTFRVGTGILGATETLTFSGTSAFKFLAKDVLASGTVEADIITESDLGAEIESETVELLKVVDQELFAVTDANKISATIDVAQGRTKFETGTGGSLVVTKTSKTPDAYAVTYVNQKFELKGDFSWIKDQNTSSTNIQAATGVVTPTNATITAITPSSIKFTATGAAAPSIAFDVDKNTAAAPDATVGAVLKATAFTLSSEADFNNANGLASNITTPFANTAVGSWKLNGSTVTVPYMVFGTVGGKTFGQVVTVTNNSNVEGTVYVDAWAADGTQLLSNKAMTTKSKAFSSTAYAGEILAALGGSYNGRVSLKITTEAPEDSVQVYAAYTDAATTERAIVVGLKKD